MIVSGSVEARDFGGGDAERRQGGSFRMQKGYDHSYFFVSTFMEEHVAFHAGRSMFKAAVLLALLAQPVWGAAEDQVLAAVNKARAGAGCAALTMNAKLAAAAHGHAKAMAEQNFAMPARMVPDFLAESRRRVIAIAGWPRISRRGNPRRQG